MESRLNIEVLLTRETDVFLPLEQRTAMANVENADLFVSLHANASKNAKAAGIETFYLGLTRDSRTQLLAAVENASAQQNLSQLEDVIKKITMYEKEKESRDFATKVHRKMISAVRKLEPSVRDRGVKKAPFVVLIGTEIPAILRSFTFPTRRRRSPAGWPARAAWPNPSPARRLSTAGRDARALRGAVRIRQWD